MENVYFGDWENFDEMLRAFCIDASDVGEIEVLFASYTYEDCYGSAFVLFRADGILYEVNGSHCSCYGLGECWEPEETMVEALKIRKYPGMDDGAMERLEHLLNTL